MTDTAYIAGLFDGEGSVTYSQRKQKKDKNKKEYKFWDIRCEISMTDKYVMEWLYTILGFGSFNEQIRELIVTRYDTAVSTIRNFSKIAGAYSRQWVVNNISLDQFSKLLTEPSNEYWGIWLYSSISDKIFQTDRS